MGEHVTALAVYPVKGCHRVELAAAEVEPWGLAGDRRWMMVDADGVGITQRDASRLTQLACRLRPGGLDLSAPGLPPLSVDEPVDGPKEFVRVFRHQAAVPARIAESAWSSAFLGREARLVWQADPTGRPLGPPASDATGQGIRPAASDATGQGIGPAGGDTAGRGIGAGAGDGGSVNLADGFPVLLANEGSLAALNDWLVEGGEEPVPMTRFRPNVVIAGAAPWAEDDWLGRRLRIGAVTFRAAQACSRCLVTTIDQETGEKGGEPLRMLGRHRRFARGLLFAINLVPESAGVLRVGDPLSVALGVS